MKQLNHGHRYIADYQFFTSHGRMQTIICKIPHYYYISYVIYIYIYITKILSPVIYLILLKLLTNIINTQIPSLLFLNPETYEGVYITSYLYVAKIFAF